MNKFLNITKDIFNVTSPLKQLVSLRLTKKSFDSGDLQSFLMLNGSFLNHTFNTAAQAFESYVRNVVVFKCIRLISNGAATLEYQLKRNGELVTNDTTGLLKLLNNPFLNMSKAEFIQTVISQYLIYGNAYIKQFTGEPNNIGISPSLLHPLRPDNVLVTEGENFLPSKYTYTPSGQTREAVETFLVNKVGQSNIIHLKTYNPMNDFVGLPFIEPIINLILQQNKANTWNTNMLASGARPSGVLTVPKDSNITPQGVEDMRDILENKWTTDEYKGKPMVLDGGMAWQQVSLNPQDMDFREIKKNTTHEIGNAYNVPMQFLNTEQPTLNNQKEANIVLWENAIIPMIETYLNELTLALAPRFDRNIVIAANEDKYLSVSERRSIQRDSIQKTDFLSINEKRNAMGLEDDPDGDVILVNFNKVPLADVGVIQPGRVRPRKDNNLKTIQKLKKKGLSLAESIELADEITIEQEV